MQSLGLSTGTPEVEPIWKTWLWPNVADEIAAKQAARNAMYGTFFVAGITTLSVFVVEQMAAVSALADALLFVLAGVGIVKMYRPAAIRATFAYHKSRKQPPALPTVKQTSA